MTWCIGRAKKKIPFVPYAVEQYELMLGLDLTALYLPIYSFNYLPLSLLMVHAW